MSSQRTDSDGLTNFIVGILKCFGFVAKCIGIGFLDKNPWLTKFKYWWVGYICISMALLFAPKWNVFYIIYRVSNDEGLKNLAQWVHQYLPKYVRLVAVPIPIVGVAFAIGMIELLKLKRVQKAIDHLGLKTTTGLAPKIVGLDSFDRNKTKFTIQSIGIDVNEFTRRKGALESGLNKIVHEVRVNSKNRQLIEILASDRDLPKIVRFEDVIGNLKTPYSFLVGESHDGIVIGNLCDLHHMLIAGATGGGKSVFFKQSLVGLLRSSSHLQLFLIDLKRGVEMKMFESLPNVFVAKNESEAIHCLQTLVQEMNRRFELLEKSGHSEIEPKRDKLDRIVVGIDEASVLFTVEKGSKSNKAQANDARELTDKLTKLGRAAGIHVILATQKVTKETIDTRVQTNIHAKMCFRVNTVASSMTVLGNGKAAELPEIRGRGIWSVGSKDVEVQVPKLDHDEAKEEIELIIDRLGGGTHSNYQELLVTRNKLRSERVNREATTEMVSKYLEVR